MDEKELRDAVDAFIEKRAAKKSKVLAQFDELPDSAHVDVRTVAGLYGCSVPTVWRRVTAGLIPTPKKFDHSTRWNVGEIRKAVAQPNAQQPVNNAGKYGNRVETRSLSIRDQFAIRALNGLLAAGWCEEERIVSGNWSTVAQDAYKAADAMLAARGIK